MFLIILIVAYIETGFGFLKVPAKTTTASTTAGPTTLHTSSTTATTASTTINGTLYYCKDFSLSTLGLNATLTGRCLSNGSTIGLWVAAGYSGRESVVIKGADNITYVNQSSSYNCLTFYENFTGPAQVYTVTLKTGSGGGSCGGATAKLNYTTVPPPTVYSSVYNGDFGTGTYTGWTETFPGFQAAPLNITYADEHMCYLNQTWKGYSGNYFATTYTCGLAVAAGNLTSSPFYANASKPFLNFRIISPLNSGFYVAILYNGTPRVVAHYNTFNSSLGDNAVATFANASIPLSSLAGKAVRVRIVSTVSGQPKPFIAVGDFSVSRTPVQTAGILVNMTFS